jgi:hypothetical protein
MRQTYPSPNENGPECNCSGPFELEFEVSCWELQAWPVLRAQRALPVLGPLVRYRAQVQL